MGSSHAALELGLGFSSAESSSLGAGNLTWGHAGKGSVSIRGFSVRLALQLLNDGLVLVASLW